MQDFSLLQVGFPFQLDGRGRMESPSYERHLEQLVEQVLLTVPGERVNRPELGCDLLPTVFSAVSQEQLAAVRMMVQAALQRWLADRIQVESVAFVTPAADVLEVKVRYQDLHRRNRRLATFEIRRS